MKKIRLLLMLCIGMQVSFSALAQDNKQIVKSYLEENQARLGLSEDDVNDWIITDEVFSKSTKITSVYIQQTAEGIPVHNAMANFAIQGNEVIYFADRLEREVEKKINGVTPEINPLQAVAQAAGQLGLTKVGKMSISNAESPRKVVVSAEGLSLNDIPVQLMFQPTKEGVKLVWDLNIHTIDGQHWWSVRVDAKTGEIISKNDWVLSCNFGDHNHSSAISGTTASTLEGKNISASVLFDDGSQYNVFAFPTESPNHGPRSIVTNPADDIASPYGWHDTNGADGAEYTITRGNNVYAQEDMDADNATMGYAPDGGTDLIFDFAYNGDADPVGNYLDAAITNLFYVNNVMHDVWYQYGFDEEAGNFQSINYSDNGIGNDHVIADAQDAYGYNNANFGTPPEGYNPRMQMFLWNPALGNALTVDNTVVAGSYLIADNVFDPGHVDLPIFPNVLTGELVLAQDAAEDENADDTDACSEITNPAALAGKIAVIRRGGCNFVLKVNNAENAGAIAVIVVNNEANAANVSMSGAEAGISIPAVFISMEDGEAIIAEMENSTINVSLSDPDSVIIARDGDFDNTIVAHEYGHGISTRLTGGANNANCLNNDEQMGEGWSDWFALMLTMESGDTSEDPRGIATYSVGDPIDGVGLRPAPYSTSWSINDYTYEDTNNPNIVAPHGMGFIWGTVLWDLTWRLIDDYGFDPDIYNGTGGNNIAMQLVIDGLKLQPCSPGFIDGRDAILAADMAAFGGANQCAIWEVFSERGMGYNASQGSNWNRFDQVNDFNMPPDMNDCDLGVEDINTGLGLSIYPNPSKGEIRIQSSLQEIEEAVVNIYDINGRLVISEKVDVTKSINAESLSTGIYVVKIIAGEKTFTEKLIME